MTAYGQRVRPSSAPPPSGAGGEIPQFSGGLRSAGSERDHARRYERRNVGWLDASQPFDQGPVPDWFAGALLDVIDDPSVRKNRPAGAAAAAGPDGVRARAGRHARDSRTVQSRGVLMLAAGPGP